MTMARSVEEIRTRLYDAARARGGDAAAGALWIAAEEVGDLDVDRYLDFLEACAEAVQRAVGGDRTSDAVRDALGDELFGRQGFRGDQSDYYDPRNSYLNEVIERRRGIPITLSIVYLAVGRRLGQPVAGVNAPGHFLVRFGSSIVDPFDGGRVWSRSAFDDHLRQLGAGDPTRHAEQLLAKPPETREILCRVLANLKANYLRRGELDRALAVVDRLVHLDPAQAQWLRERAALYQHLDCPRAAAADLERYLERVPTDPEADGLRTVLVDLKGRGGTLH
jgi:regulator of sirC expression with transglutaminase-like and TPR domain